MTKTGQRYSTSTAPRSAEYHHLYNSRRWRRIRAQQLEAQPFCVFCRGEGRLIPATVCDHIEPHRGDVARFYAGPFQSLCKRCHDSAKARIESGSGPIGCDESGMPINPRHHWHVRH